MNKRHTLLLGTHVSAAGGFYRAIEQGQALGCTAIQIFTKSNQQWNARPITAADAAQFITYWQQSSIQSVVAHAAYLINLGSAKEDVFHKSCASLQLELERCHMLQIPYLVLHPGSNGSTEGDNNACLQRIAKAINTILSKTEKTTLLLETMAGQGSTVGNTFEQLAYLIDAIEYKDRIGVCVDTCHIFVAGYDIRTPASYHEVWRTFDATIGLQRLKAIHLNDSKKGYQSRIDRHEHIGEGTLGLEPFKLLLNDERFFDIPKILETPKTVPEVDDRRNLATLKGLLSAHTKKMLHITD